MTSRKPKQILRSLESKGFKVSDNGRSADHVWLTFHSGGKAHKKVRTKISHGSKVSYSGYLLSAVKRQLGLDSVDDLLRLIDCPMDQAEFERILRGKKLIP